MGSLHIDLSRLTSSRPRISIVDVIAVLAALLSLATLSVLIPSGMHFPF